MRNLFLSLARKIYNTDNCAISSDARSTHPTSPQEALQQIIANFQDSDEEEGSYADPEDTEAVAHAKKTAKETGEFSYTERDVILYNLGIGATEQELHWVFENDDHFSALPSFGVIPQFSTSSSLPMDFLPNFNPVSSGSVQDVCPGAHCTFRPNCFTESSTYPSKSRYLPMGLSSALPGFWRCLTKARLLP